LAYIIIVFFGCLVVFVQCVNNEIKSSTSSNGSPNVRREGHLEAGEEDVFYCSSSVLYYSPICLCWTSGLHPTVQAKTMIIRKTLQQIS